MDFLDSKITFLKNFNEDVLGGPPKKWNKILYRERASAREHMLNNNEKRRVFDRAVSPYIN